MKKKLSLTCPFVTSLAIFPLGVTTYILIVFTRNIESQERKLLYALQTDAEKQKQAIVVG